MDEKTNQLQPDPTPPDTEEPDRDRPAPPGTEEPAHARPAPPATDEPAHDRPASPGTEESPHDRPVPPPGTEESRDERPAPPATDEPAHDRPAPSGADEPSHGLPARSEGESGRSASCRPAAAGGEDAAQGPPAGDDESRTGGAGGSTRADGEAEAKRPRPRPRRRTLLATALVLLLLLPLLTAEAALRLNYTGTPKPGTLTRHKDALWLGHAWVDGRKSAEDVRALAHRLNDTGVRDLYIHAGPLEDDGTLPKSSYPDARWLITALHDAAPRVRVQAWLGDKLASEGPDGLHLERAATRAAIVTSARHILATGFQGTHFDLEPLHSGDRDYLSLLDDLRTLTRSHHALLSVAAHQIDPLPAFHSFWGATTGHPKWWSQAYFGQVARRVDQIAVMSYDTMQPLESLYGGYVAQQTSLALEATPDTTDLLMGLPFYHENRFGHWARAETVPAAVRGVRLGLSRTDAGRSRFGVALYVDFAATEADWRAYQEDWVSTWRDSGADGTIPVMRLFMVVGAWLAVAVFAAGGIAGIRADWVPRWLRHRVMRPRLWGYGTLLMTLGLALELLTGPLDVARFGGFGFFAWWVVFLAGVILQVLSQSPGRNPTKTSS